MICLVQTATNGIPEGATTPAPAQSGSATVDDNSPALRQPTVGRVGRCVFGRPELLLERVYGLICSPALAEITGEGRPWTVSMISALSMPWR